jgi:hypothetical protein
MTLGLCSSDMMTNTFRAVSLSLVMTQHLVFNTAKGSTH